MTKQLQIAFDIDDTLWKIVPSDAAPLDGRTRYKQVPDYDLIQVLKWFHANGSKVFVWSAGGVDYTQVIIDKLGLEQYVTVIPKKGWDEDTIERGEIDIAFDDEDVTLGKVNVQIKRDAREEY